MNETVNETVSQNGTVNGTVDNIYSDVVANSATTTTTTTLDSSTDNATFSIDEPEIVADGDTSQTEIDEVDAADTADTADTADVVESSLEGIRGVIGSIGGEGVLELLIGGSEQDFVDKFSAVAPRAEIVEGRNKMLSLLRLELHRRDLAEIRQKYPFVTAKEVADLPNPEKFAKFRCKNLSAVESFEASSMSYITSNLPKRKADMARSQSQNKLSHMKPISGVSGAKGGSSIPKDELAIWKSAFPNDSVKELETKRNKVISR